MPSICRAHNKHFPRGKKGKHEKEIEKEIVLNQRDFAIDFPSE